ncbi:DUF1801 domain-containing protein [Catalinimonas niigatensis]|uniref:DUF1801 domain-containing protein n=1 Tax=Catalinimonas niigatensis TaxID=1397264 RepID=UPI002666A0A3|nr:DUF1801 domain-containing protein [Catalinimonas niigatensis]WPP52933.1 DUF1801 domain-containing protein [Catalinimonas niigatensis]
MATQNIKPEKLSGHAQVREFLDQLEHPLKAEIEEVRSIILEADPRLTEHIKWKAPSFCFNDDDRITFNLHGRDFFRLIFHCGVKVRDRQSKGRLFEEPTGLLDWVADDRAVAKFTDMDDVRTKKASLMETVKIWLELAG